MRPSNEKSGMKSAVKKQRFHWGLMFTESISFLRSNSRRFAALTGNNGRAIDCNSVPSCYTNNHLCSTFRNERFPNESTITRAIREFESPLFSNDSRLFLYLLSLLFSFCILDLWLQLYCPFVSLFSFFFFFIFHEGRDIVILLFYTLLVFCLKKVDIIGAVS